MILLATASAAHAQDDAFHLEVSNIISPAQPSATIRLLASFDPTGPADAFAFAGARLRVVATESGWSSPIVLPGGAGPGSQAGAVSIGGDRMEGLALGQAHLPAAGVFPDPSNPLAIWEATFEVVDFSARRIDLSTQTSEFRVYIDLFPGAESRLASLSEARAVIHVVPAPAPIVLLAAACGPSMRRRRCARGEKP
jgi:hypothetical protein